MKHEKAEKVYLGGLVPVELKAEFQRVLIEKFGHVGSKISPTLEQIIREWIEKQKKAEGGANESQEGN
jgi:hypothetical protein